MFKNHLIEILKDVKNIKASRGFDIIDSHIHPLDVMGVVHYGEIADECKHEDYLKPGILEMFNYSKIEKIGSRVYFNFFPKSVDSIIRSTYQRAGIDRIVGELEESLTDKGVLLSLDPWAPTKNIGETYMSNRKFYVLGSIDIHTIDPSAVEATIKSYIDLYKIVGLKLHPNLQNFKPQPSHNDPIVEERLRKIYETAAKYNLYMLFHGGISNYTEKANEKYGKIERSRTNGLLKNFCNPDGTSELLGKYNVPIIIAHIGHYGIANPDYDLIKMIHSRHENVFFDTSGVSTPVISKALIIMPSTRLVFGSDALYNRIAYNMAFLYCAAKQCHTGEKYDTILENVLGNNFITRILHT